MTNDITKAIMANLSAEKSTTHHFNGSVPRLSRQESKILSDIIHRGLSMKDAEDKSDNKRFKEDKFHAAGITLDELAKLK